MRTKAASAAVFAAAVLALLFPAHIAQAAWSVTGSGNTRAASLTLSAPTSPTISGGGTTTLTIGWTPTASTWASGYKIYRSATSGSGYAEVGTAAGAAATSWADTPGMGTWYYVVRAYATGWLSAQTSQVSATTANPTHRDLVLTDAAATTGTDCPAAATSTQNMTEGYTAGSAGAAQSVKFGNSTFGWCSPVLGAGATVGAGTSTLTVWASPVSNKDCVNNFTVAVAGGTPSTIGTGTITVMRNGSTTPVQIATNFTSAAKTLTAGQRITLTITGGPNSDCSSVFLNWNSAAAPSLLSLRR